MVVVSLVAVSYSELQIRLPPATPHVENPARGRSTLVGVSSTLAECPRGASIVCDSKKVHCTGLTFICSPLVGGVGRAGVGCAV